MRLFLFILCQLPLLIPPPAVAQAQRLQPGFDKAEYLELLRLHVRQADDTTFFAGIPKPTQFRRVYRSPIVGLDNRWELWANGRGVVAVSVRGTTRNNVSWLENFYAAMLPAKGELQLTSSQTFRYELAQNPQAAVHAGWLLGMASLVGDVERKLDSCARRGTNQVLLMGHSQGGAIAYLLTAHLRTLQLQGRFPANVQLKTYCSAAPKPGNQPFAYEYEAATYGTNGGWSFNVVNAADWVPETPVSVQTFDDFNVVNPFTGAHDIIRRQPFPKRVALGYVFRQLDRPARKTQRAYQKYLGRLASRQVQKQLPDYRPGDYFSSNNYVRTGVPIILLPDAAYYQRFPNDPAQIFVHHLFQPYYYLAERLSDRSIGK